MQRQLGPKAVVVESINQLIEVVVLTFAGNFGSG
jgi:hypothetical protein